jgi:hypothetical protein
MARSLRNAGSSRSATNPEALVIDDLPNIRAAIVPKWTSEPDCVLVPMQATSHNGLAGSAGLADLSGENDFPSNHSPSRMI